MTVIRRRFPFRHVVAACGLATIGWVIATVARSPDGPAPLAPAEVPTPPAGGATAPPTTSVEEPAAPVRRAGGPGITAPPEGLPPPERVEPPPPPPPPPATIRERRMMPVTMEDTATVVAGGLRVRLPGVAIVGRDETCRDRDGTIWPCGRRALAGVRAVVRGRAIDCPLPEGVRRGAFVADCRLGEADLAERLVASGWARALDAESPLGEIERQAAARGLGLHAATAPNLVDPFPEPGETPADPTNAPLGGDPIEPRSAAGPSGGPAPATEP